MKDAAIGADFDEKLNDQSYQRLEEIVEDYKNFKEEQLEQIQRPKTAPRNIRGLSPNKLQTKSKNKFDKKTPSRNKNKDIKDRYMTVPTQEIEDLFSGRQYGTKKSKKEQTVLKNWKRFMTRNYLTETHYKSLIKDYNHLSNGPIHALRKKDNEEPSQNIDNCQKLRLDYALKVSQLGSK